MTTQSRPQFVRTNSAQIRQVKLPAPAAVPTFEIGFASEQTEPRNRSGHVDAEAQERTPPYLPEGRYAKTEWKHELIDKLLASLKVVRGEDLVREYPDVFKSRANADWHLVQCAAEGRLCLGFEPHRGQVRYVCTRDFRVLAELVECAPVVRPGESTPPGPRSGDSGMFQAVGGRKRRSSSRPPRKAAGNGVA